MDDEYKEEEEEEEEEEAIYDILSNNGFPVHTHTPPRSPTQAPRRNTYVHTTVWKYHFIVYI